MRTRCPYCGRPAMVRSSRPLTPAAVEFWAVCLNVACACSFYGIHEVQKLLSPSIYPTPLCRLPRAKRGTPDWPGDGLILPPSPNGDLFTDDPDPPPTRPPP